MSTIKFIDMRKIIPLNIFCLLLFISTKAQNIYRLNNRFDTEKFDTLYKQNSNGSLSTRPQKIANSLKGYISKQSEDRDTLFIKFWNIDSTSDIYKRNIDTINSIDDNGAFFAYKINWENDIYFKVPFSAKTITATSIPFRYRLKKGADLEAEFLSVGVNLFFVSGVTKLFKQEQIEPRQNYWGWGPFVAFSQLKIDSSNTAGNVKTEKQVATISYGLSGVRSWNGFNIILAIGFDNAFGRNGKHWEENNFKHGLKPWIGFGFGFKLTELSFKPTNNDK